MKKSHLRFKSDRAEELHNPRNYTPERYGASEGYRLLFKSEAMIVSDIRCYDIESEWIERGIINWNRGWHGGSDSETYRTKLTPEELKIARGIK